MLAASAASVGQLQTHRQMRHRYTSHPCEVFMRVSSDALAGLLRPPPPKPKQPTARERAAANRLRVLQAVAEHGSLRCADLAAACWPGARYGEQMAQRTVRALVAAGELMPRRNALGGVSVVLTRPGTAALEVRGVVAHHGLDLSVSGPAFRHSALTARWCIHKRSQSFQTFTEYAIAQGRAPLSRELLFKRLGRHVDAVLIKGDKLYAVETESAPKDTGWLMRIAAMAELVGRRLHPDLPFTLAGVFVVFDAEQNHAGRIARAARERWQRYSAADQTLLAGRVTLARVSLGLSLVWRGCSEERLTLARV